MRASLLALVLAACCVAVASAAGAVADVQYTPAALADEISHLPGLAAMPSFRMFSGYLVVDESVNRSIFYCQTGRHSATQCRAVPPAQGSASTWPKRPRRHC